MRYDLEIVKALWIEAKDDLARAKTLFKDKGYSKTIMPASC